MVVPNGRFSDLVSSGKLSRAPCLGGFVRCSGVPGIRAPYYPSETMQRSFYRQYPGITGGLRFPEGQGWRKEGARTIRTRLPAEQPVEKNFMQPAGRPCLRAPP